MKLPQDILAWLEREAEKTHRPRSAVLRDILRQHKDRQTQSALDLAADLCGCADSGLGDLSRNKNYLRRFGK